MPKHVGHTLQAIIYKFRRLAVTARRKNNLTLSIYLVLVRLFLVFFAMLLVGNRA